jgi:hypothetical protein
MAGAAPLAGEVLLTALTAKQVKDLIRRTQECFSRIDHDDWDGSRYRTHETAKWQQAAKETSPAEWREIIRVLAQGESYYGGKY